MKRFRLRDGMALAFLLLVACALLAACGATDAAREAGEQPREAASVLLDGAPWDGEPIPGEDAGGLRVYVTLDGAALIDLPFDQARTVAVVQPDGEENVIALTGEAVYMLSANCDNQDCVQMGEVTPENLELRVLGGFIICLPHRVSVEVR